jgi:hypothetical protein
MIYFILIRVQMRVCSDMFQTGIAGMHATVLRCVVFPRAVHEPHLRTPLFQQSLHASIYEIRKMTPALAAQI